MKRVLITGVNSYIGKSVVGYLEKYNEKLGKEAYQVVCISQRTPDWEQYDFSAYDSILDVTGISQVDERKLGEEQENNYYEINSHLACKTAQKAKREGIKQFIYLSSILVYGDAGLQRKSSTITESTKLNPTSIYGKSKCQAEGRLKELEEETFQVAIVRLPFVYGPDCKNGYALLSRWAGKLPLIPTTSDEKSMIYIENLCEFLRLLIEAEVGGVYFPQNATTASTMRMLEEIRTVRGRSTYKCSLLNPVIRLLMRMPGRCGKVTRRIMAGQCYELSMSNALGNYQIVDLVESIQRTEGKGKG